MTGFASIRQVLSTKLSMTCRHEMPVSPLSTALRLLEVKKFILVAMLIRRKLSSARGSEGKFAVHSIHPIVRVFQLQV